MGKSYKTEYQDATKEGQRKDTEISGLRSQLSELEGKFNTQSTSHTKEKTDLEAKIVVLGGEITDLEKKKNDVEGKSTELSEQLRKKELSRFASEYEKQEKEYEKQQDLWFKLSLGATGLLTISVVGSIVAPLFLENKQWYQEPGFYLLNLIFITLFIYALNQHSHLGNLRIDYANRKILAQSYQYIIEDEEETSPVRKEFLGKALEIFTSRAMLKTGGVTVYENLLEKFSGKK